MAAVQAECVRASLLFVGDLNGHHQEWLGSATTSRHGVAAFDFATVSGCDQLVVEPTHARGGTPDLLISMAQAVPNLCVSKKVFLKHQVNWSTVCGAMHDLSWRNI